MLPEFSVVVGLTTQGYSMSSELKIVSSKIIFPGGQGIPHSIIILLVMVLFIAKTVLWLEDPMKGMSMSSINDLNEEKKISHFEKPCFTLTHRPRIDLNKRSLPRPNTITAIKLIPHQYQQELKSYTLGTFLLSKMCFEYKYFQICF